MDDVARLPPTDRSQLFAAVAGQRGLLPEIIEKDFWVCWTLKRLFSLPDLPAGLIFKGGTSLSKVFHAIERFSEDVDLSFDRADLGFGGGNDPVVAKTGKKRRQQVEALVAECRRVIQGEFRTRLMAAITEQLGDPATGDWQLELDAHDPDGQTLLFRYPVAIAARDRDLGYIRPFVRLEFGARSDHWPKQEGTVSPYAAEAFPNVFREPSCRVHVLSAERTFWEKATLLHAWYHTPSHKKFRDRQSRHYYDVVRLYEHGVGQRAMTDLTLLQQVAQHKSVFFALASAHYAEAKPGTLHLAPPEARIPELEEDYRKMREMIFGDVPSFDHLLTTLAKIEAAVNSPE